MDYNIETKDIAPIRVAYIPYKGEISGCNKLFPTIFKSIGGKSCGAPFLNYYGFDVENHICIADVCVPTEEMPRVSSVKIKEIPYTKALCTTHIGHYEALSSAYKELKEYAKKYNAELKLPYREIYIKGPGMLLKGNPSKYVTKIIFPIA